MYIFYVLCKIVYIYIYLNLCKCSTVSIPHNPKVIYIIQHVVYNT